VVLTYTAILVDYSVARLTNQVGATVHHCVNKEFEANGVIGWLACHNHPLGLTFV